MENDDDDLDQAAAAAKGQPTRMNADRREQPLIAARIANCSAIAPAETRATAAKAASAAAAAASNTNNFEGRHFSAAVSADDANITSSEPVAVVVVSRGGKSSSSSSSNSSSGSSSSSGSNSGSSSASSSHKPTTIAGNNESERRRRRSQRASCDKSDTRGQAAPKHEHSTRQHWRPQKQQQQQQQRQPSQLTSASRSQPLLESDRLQASSSSVNQLNHCSSPGIDGGSAGDAAIESSVTIERQVNNKNDEHLSGPAKRPPSSGGSNTRAVCQRQAFERRQCQESQQDQRTRESSTKNQIASDNEDDDDACKQSARVDHQLTVEQQQLAASGVDSEPAVEQAAAGASLQFWKFLSNLPTSITQRGRSPAGSSGLAPEVAGYLASRRKCDTMKASASNSMSSAAATGDSNRATNVDRLGGADCVRQQQQPPPPYQEMEMMNCFSKQAATAAAAAAAAANKQAASAGPTPNQSKLIRIVAPPAESSGAGSGDGGGHQHHYNIQQSSSIDDRLTNYDNERQQQPQLRKNSHTKLSIATTATTTTRSSATSLSSCILSESSESEVVRLKWGKKMDFLLSIIGFAVDLANIWRFPYLVYKNGGGVFLIPYLTMLVFGGIPLFFLELCLGQFVKKGPITVWNKICPSMKGVGYCSILISWYVSFYYNVLIAWSVYFIYRSLSSFGNKMPWEDCDNSWNDKATCVSISQLKELCSFKNETLEACRKEMFAKVDVTSPASEFFVKELSQIDQSTGLDDMGYLRWELVFCTMIVYLLHYFSLFRGLETSGKVVWVTATAPYMILSILLVRGLFLPGASMGIEYYLSPKLEKLADPQVWIDAAGQVFYSIGVGFGVHLTYASFNSHNNNCYRDCLMTSAVNALTSVYSGLVVFVYLGYMAKNLGIEIDKVASEGYSLVFEVYPEALTTLPFARFWSILFFIMLLTLGIDSAMGGLEAVITGLEDEFKLARRLSRGQLTGLVIFSSFLPALISCTQGGAYTLFWFDIYSAGVSLLFSALFETIGVVYCYGLNKFILDIESMLGRRPPLFYILCWKYISPLFLCGVIFMSIYTAGVPTYRGYTFPLWSVILGWCLAFSSVAAIPIVAILYWGNRWFKRSSLDKSSKKRDRGSSSIGSGSRHGSSKKSPSHRSVSVSCGLQSQGGLTTTSVLAKSPSDQKNHNHPAMGDSIEDML